MDILKCNYGKIINKLEFIDGEEFWKILDIVVEFHDIGKAFSPFQKLIRENMDEKLTDEDIITNLENNINHNYISPAFIKYRDLGINDRKLMNLIDQAIVYHHERDVEIDEKFELLVKIALEEDLINKVEELQNDFKVRYPIKTKKLNNSYLQNVKKRITKNDDYYYLYVMLKGILHKLDHSASAHELVEADCDKYIGRYTEEFIINEYGDLRDVQRFAKNNREKNIMLIASTGGTCHNSDRVHKCFSIKGFRNFS